MQPNERSPAYSILIVSADGSEEVRELDADMNLMDLRIFIETEMLTKLYQGEIINVVISRKKRDALIPA